ncbi:MAG: hypothetical protein E7052_04825 [Lentisphaerae bacterium]|nr:hypothetical protein [Lentisphaerota bacterium]
MLLSHLAAAENLLANGDFNGKELQQELSLINQHGAIKLIDFTEDMTWNKCLKAEVASVRTLKDGTQLLTAEIVFGKNALPVEPATLYNFSFDVKGGLLLSMFVYCDQAPVKNIAVKAAKIIRPQPRSVKGDAQNWSTVKGFFKTPSDTRYIRFVIRFWANSKTQRRVTVRPGDHILLDNVKLEKKSTLDSISLASPAAKEKRKVNAYLAEDSVKTSLPFLPRPWLKNKPELPVELKWQRQGENMHFTLSIKDIHPNQVTGVAENGLSIWQDNVAEIFFAPVDGSGRFYQFACSASGGRYRGINGKAQGEFDRWQASAEKVDGKIIYDFTIPFALFTDAGYMPDGSLIKFNIGFKYNKVDYSFMPVTTGFSELGKFALMNFGSIQSYQTKAAAELKNNVPEKLISEINAFAGKKFDNIAQAIQAAETLQNKIRHEKMGSAPFVAAVMPLAGDFSYPLEIGLENIITQPIKLQAAQNEIAMLPLVICNRTAAPAAYRVVVHNDAKNFFMHENPTLGNNFPAENITLREAVPVKDSEGKNISQLFDALPIMNQANTVTVPARGCGMVWIEFDTAKTAAGHYPGSIRIIPLAEPAEHTHKKYSGATQDYPITLEVLPFKLGRPDNSWLCAYSGSTDHLKYMLQLGGSRIHISPYVFKFKFDSKGNLIDDNGSTEKAVELFKTDLERFRQNNAMHVKPKFMFAYGIAGIFKRVALPKTIKPLTPEWENCWINYLKAVHNAILQSGLTLEDVVFELWDEPKGEIHAELLRMTQLARQTLPNGRFTITWAAQKFQYKAEQMQEYDDLLDEQTFHWMLRNDPAYLPQIRKIQQKKHVISGMYQCSTSLREDLYSYFRLHPWRVFYGNYDMMGFYDFCAVNWGQVGASDWKRVPYGGIVYRSGNACIPSIRFMLLRRGVDDVRYLKLLQKYQHHAEVSQFLREAPGRVVNTAHNTSLSDEVRNQAIKLLLKYSK